MNTFLHDVACSLFAHYGERLADIDVVFASRRASRYLFKELATIGAPRPHCHSMDSWIAQHAENVKSESRFVLISKLYAVYSKYHADESFEQFYSFGSLLIADFDMIDRYMVDAKALYSIVSDTRDVELANSDPLREAAIEFWSRFDTTNAERHKQQEFLRVWHSLYDIYREFNDLLRSEQIAYSGRIYRIVAEDFDASTYGRQTVFVGLNALSESEKLILSKLNDQHIADFIWDYDPRWIDNENSECGYFISHNIKLFEQAHYFQTSIYDPSQVKIDVIEAPSDAAQCKLLPAILDSIAAKAGKIDERVAIVLTDENLLVPLLYSLPKSVEQFNISMGYPLRASMAYRFIELLIRAQRRARSGRFYRTDISALLSHPYLSDYKLDDSDKLFLSIDDICTQTPDQIAFLWRFAWSDYRTLNDYLRSAMDFIDQSTDDPKESLFITQLIDSLTIVSSTIAQSGQEVSITLYLSLLSEVISEQSVEFEGVSGRGLQIMGILESRTLDFDHVILLSLNDDNFPSSRPDSSFIPQLLLQGYGMPTITEKSAIWSYYFYRLLQRASDVKLLYCNVSDGMTTGEQSRYIWQLEYSSQYQLTRQRVSIGTAPIIENKQITIEKTEEMVSALRSKRYYPTMFASYRSCPLSFYFSSVERIERPTVDQERISAADTGNLLHKVMQSLYGQLLGKAEVTRYIAQITDEQIAKTIDSAIVDELGQKTDNEQSMVAITRLTLQRMISAIVGYDALSSDLFRIEMVEQKINGTIAGVEFAGVIDRVDRLIDGSIRVIDYKSGAVDAKCDSIEELFDERATQSHNAIMAQMLIYSVLARKKWAVDISPAIYCAREMANTDREFCSSISIEKEQIGRLSDTHYQQIESAIKSTFERLTNPTIPFVQTVQIKTCQYCPYAPICRR